MTQGCRRLATLALALLGAAASSGTARADEPAAPPGEGSVRLEASDPFAAPPATMRRSARVIRRRAPDPAPPTGSRARPAAPVKPERASPRPSEATTVEWLRRFGTVEARPRSEP